MNAVMSKCKKLKTISASDILLSLHFRHNFRAGRFSRCRTSFYDKHREVCVRHLLAICDTNFLCYGFFRHLHHTICNLWSILLRLNIVTVNVRLMNFEGCFKAKILDFLSFNYKLTQLLLKKCLNVNRKSFLIKHIKKSRIQHPEIINIFFW